MGYNRINKTDITTELEQAAQSRLSFFCCRLPGEDSYLLAKGVSLLKSGEYKSGLIMAPFMNAGNRVLLFGIENDDTLGIPLYPFPERTTGRDEHRQAVEHITSRLKYLRDIKKESESRKTVSATVKIKDTVKRTREIFIELCEAYPLTFAFLVSSEISGTWVGASPELLCKVRGNVLTTMALAGTRSTGSSSEWDKKNREEQAIVAKTVVSTLRKYCESVDVSSTYTKEAGPVEHLCCDITARLPECDNINNKHEVIRTLITDLSPTPALCGFPRKEALLDIQFTEKFQRGYYGGYLGVVSDNGDIDLYVNLRSMRMSENKAALFAGGGIMADSDPDSEWEETERKASTLSKFL